MGEAKPNFRRQNAKKGGSTMECCQHVSSITCNPVSEYAKFGKCCRLCPPGTYMSSECSEKNDSKCQPCGPDRYQSDWNKLEHCHLQKVCNNNGGFVVEKAGTSTSDTICQCQVGKHCLNKDCEICEGNSVCEPGYGVVYKERGNFTVPVCEICEAGYYSNVSSNLEACRKWSDCGSLQMLVNGTTTKDVECGTPEPPSKVGLVVVIVLLSAVLTVILLSFFIYSGYNQENRTKAWITFTRLLKCAETTKKPIQELTENGRILATAGDEDKSPEMMTELLPV
ncbi:tumor necrosis factor receptor superfamily member 5-like isoform X2 [Pristis pectinata]|uniref:tumor necrosis factor receptor superfamily member 5-like isoform X2 n=1 Tax=Pristis pectinata TaxID=685728 RepID=UPI00223E39A0|nr:tumor necrosis factor receptor superfamily member 5-like isoform X2 [Pristis pectinata]